MNFRFGLIVIISLFILTGILRLNDLSFYTPDSCRYLVLGNALAHGKGFVDDTQPDPERFVINAPLYAVLISPVEVVFPLSIIAVKLWTLLFAVAAIVLFSVWLRRFYGEKSALIGAILLAFNPAFLFLSTEMLSEAPFIAAILLVMLLIDWEEGSQKPAKKYFLCLLLCCFCIVVLRETGVALVMALVLFYLIRRSGARAASVLAVTMVSFGGWYLRNSHWMVVEGKEMHNNLSLITKHFVTPETTALPIEIVRRLWLSLESYAEDLGGRLYFPLSSSQLTGMFRVNASDLYGTISGLVVRVEFLIILLVSVLMVAGCMYDFRRSTAWLRIFFIILYIVVICIYPVRDIRFLLPLLPCMIFYTLGGVQWCSDHLWKSFPRTGYFIFGMLIVLMLPNFLGIQQLIALNIRYNRFPDEMNKIPGLPIIYRYEWRKLNEWIPANVPESCVIASPVKDLVVVSGGRKVLEIDPGVALPGFENLLRDNQVGFIFAPARWSDLRDYEFLMRESRRFWFEPIAAAPNLMKVHSRIFEQHITVTPHNDFDTTRTSELLRLGRSDLMHGEYEAASALFARALSRAPSQIAVLYQVVVAAMLRVDTAAVSSLYNQLLQMPQALSYAQMARAQWDAYYCIVESNASGQSGRRLLLREEAAKLYWNLGYYHRAAELLDGGMSDPASSFSSIASGVYYNLQNGDLLKAHGFLGRLRSMDSSSSVVRSFEKIISLNDSLTSVTVGEVKSDLHLSQAMIYSSLGFPGEATDEGERAIYDNPRNVGALEFLAREYLAREYSRRALQIAGAILTVDPKNIFALSLSDSLRNTITRM